MEKEKATNSNNKLSSFGHAMCSVQQSHLDADVELAIRPKNEMRWHLRMQTNGEESNIRFSKSKRRRRQSISSSNPFYIFNTISSFLIKFYANTRQRWRHRLRLHILSSLILRFRFYDTFQGKISSTLSTIYSRLFQNCHIPLTQNFIGVAVVSLFRSLTSYPAYSH